MPELRGVSDEPCSSSDLCLGSSTSHLMCLCAIKMAKGLRSKNNTVFAWGSVAVSLPESDHHHPGLP